MLNLTVVWPISSYASNRMKIRVRECNGMLNIVIGIRMQTYVNLVHLLDVKMPMRYLSYVMPVGVLM